MSDLELLSQYVRTGSQEAFAQIVRLYVDMVYSAARRQLRDAHLAEDVTQKVFVLLARKAPSLKREVLLGGWLYNAAGLKDKAVVEYEEVLKKKPDYADRKKLEQYISENKKH